MASILLYAHNETSTGALSPVHHFGDDDALTVVDATSATGGVLVDLSEVLLLSPTRSVLGPTAASGLRLPPLRLWSALIA